MGLQKMKDGIGDLVKGNYWFGRTFTNRFLSDSRWGGLFDAAAGVGITALGVSWGISNIVKGALAVTAIASAPATAVVTLAVSTVFLILDCMLVGFGTGFLSAAYTKSGLPWPSTMFNNARNAVSTGASKGAAAVKKVFKPLTSIFRKSAEKKPSGAAPTAPASSPKIGGHTIF